MKKARKRKSQSGLRDLKSIFTETMKHIEESRVYVKCDFGCGSFYIVPTSKEEENILADEVMKLVGNLIKKGR